eukprot:CAMPEP_0115018224 /NCGR_PEP_ID=MMETSP0216-20121206/28655_1 /TAXON_ID=223996 /ORGANISM="Protocruzia adherens, Strain Boccale" /LENGTH=490 /DNA_ID=CAMNT_0002389331 /DNA_START=18 /DNA_END=1490 /DNA_ORIENTATION=-
MSATYLEKLRQALEDRENLEKAVSRTFLYKQDNPKESVFANHMAANLIERVGASSSKAAEYFDDPKGLRQQELADGTESNREMWRTFYEKIREIKEYNRKFPQESLPDILDDEWMFEHNKEEVKRPQFSGEEFDGKFVDLHHHFLVYQNLRKLREFKSCKITDYIIYLRKFDQFHLIPKEGKDKAYEHYLRELSGYLFGFLQRTQPLYDFNDLQARFDEEFEERWENRQVVGWEMVIESCKDIKNNLYCVPCEKQFTNESVFESHKKGRKHIKNVDRMSKSAAEFSNPEATRLNGPLELETKYKSIAHTECLIGKYREMTEEIIEQTVNQVRKKKTQTWAELEADREETSKVDEIMSESSEDEDMEFNPKSLPLGWDGKPIPVWLYKLHGLNIEYKCEICGNYSYRGRRAFERHFQEWKHAYGMKCLGIPNTKHFKEVTRIDEAKQLYNEMMERAKTNQFQPDRDEEFEDSSGNVINKKTYVDMQKQGIL